MAYGQGLMVVAWSFLLCCCGQYTHNREQIMQFIQKSRRLPSLDICGKSASTFDTKIINGKPAELGAYPWMAAIGYKLPSSTNPEWLCGGSLITDQYVITAAHCLDPVTLKARRPWQPTTIRLGDLDLNPQINDGAAPEDIEIGSTVYHPQYSNLRKENDIGLVKLTKKVLFRDLIRPICLPPPEFQTNLFIGYSPIVAGWGKSVTSYGVKSGTRLLEAEVVIRDTEECRRNITSIRFLNKAIIDHRVLCASTPGKDSCQGDSGGPLMLYRKLRKQNPTATGNIFLMGIVSYGYGCAVEGYPGVYTRVSEYMSWIINNIDI